jgi:rod shape-determining protein MreD
MRWITFFILLYGMDALQMGRLGGIPHGGDHWPRIEYLPILAIFYALFAAESAAPLCGLICGICYDLAAGEMIGTTAVPLALMSLMVVHIRLSIFREHFLSQLLITFLAILAFALMSVIMRKVVNAPLDGHSVWTHFGHLATDALYSAVVAPIFYGLFFRFQSLLGFSSHGPRTRIHEARR